MITPRSEKRSDTSVQKSDWRSSSPYWIPPRRSTDKEMNTPATDSFWRRAKVMDSSFSMRAKTRIRSMALGSLILSPWNNECICGIGLISLWNTIGISSRTHLLSKRLFQTLERSLVPAFHSVIRLIENFRYFMEGEILLIAKRENRPVQRR